MGLLALTKLFATGQKLLRIEVLIVVYGGVEGTETVIFFFYYTKSTHTFKTVLFLWLGQDG